MVRETSQGYGRSLCDVGEPSYGERLRFNMIQTRGYHNAYMYHHRKPFWAFPWTQALIPAVWYTHPPLAEQLDNGNRNMELDFHVTASGKVLGMHLPVLDDNTECDCLADCLAELKKWSDDHPDHHGITIIAEPKCW